MTIKRATDLIEQNNRAHFEDIDLYGEILKKYDEFNKRIIKMLKQHRETSERYEKVDHYSTKS